MKVLFVSHDDDKFGAPRSLLALVDSLKNTNNVDPIILTPVHNNINKKCDEMEIENYSIKYKSFVYQQDKSQIKTIIKVIIKWIIYKYYNAIALFKLNKKIDLNEIDIIHTNVSTIDIGAIVSRKYGVPHVWHLREFGEEDFKTKAFKYNVTEYMNKNAEYFIAISNAVKKSWEHKGITSEKIKVIYNGIQIENINRDHKKNAIPFENLNIVFAGALGKHKGQIQLVEAMNLIPKKIKEYIQVDFIGDGSHEYTEMLKGKIKKYNLENNINLLGYRSDANILFKDYDVGVVCSRSEGFGRVTAEYMMSGLCVIASNTGANEELVEDNKNGFIYEYNNAKDLSDKIIMVFNNRSILTRIGIEAATKARNEYTIDMNSNSIYYLYKEILHLMK